MSYLFKYLGSSSDCVMVQHLPNAGSVPHLCGCKRQKISCFTPGALVAFQGSTRTKMTPPAMISEAFMGSCSSTVLKLLLNPIALIWKIQWRSSCSGSNHHLFSVCVVGYVLMLPHTPSAVTNHKNKRL